MTEKKRILTGDRPTGPLHLGHYIGSLQNRIRYQQTQECFFIIADLHTLTTRSDPLQIAGLQGRIERIVLDYLSVGIDPSRATIFLQSSIPAVSELSLLLGMLVSVPRLERIPSLKEMAAAEGLDTLPFGLLGYPVLMAADILLPRATLVPVGADNQGNVELARELARRFNHRYQEIFPIPEMVIESTLVGTDGGAKMSKSLGNAILLSDSVEEVTRKVMGMYTDPKRIRADIPGRVAGNPVFIYHDHFNSDRNQVAELKDRYRRGKVGDVEVKKKLAAALNDFLEPIRERRERFSQQPELIRQILEAGAERMNAEAERTLGLVREAMQLPQIDGSQSKHKRASRLEALGGLAFM